MQSTDVPLRQQCYVYIWQAKTHADVHSGLPQWKHSKVCIIHSVFVRCANMYLNAAVPNIHMQLLSCTHKSNKSKEAYLDVKPILWIWILWMYSHSSLMRVCTLFCPFAINYQKLIVAEWRCLYFWTMCTSGGGLSSYGVILSTPLSTPPPLTPHTLPTKVQRYGGNTCLAIQCGVCPDTYTELGHAQPLVMPCGHTARVGRRDPWQKNHQCRYHHKCSILINIR